MFINLFRNTLFRDSVCLLLLNTYFIGMYIHNTSWVCIFTTLVAFFRIFTLNDVLKTDALFVENYQDPIVGCCAEIMKSFAKRKLASIPELDDLVAKAETGKWW